MEDEATTKRMNALRKEVLGSNRWTADRQVFDAVMADILEYFDKQEPDVADLIRYGRGGGHTECRRANYGDHYVTRTFVEINYPAGHPKATS